MVKSDPQVGVAFLLRKSASHLSGALFNLAPATAGARFHKNRFQFIKVFNSNICKQHCVYFPQRVGQVKPGHIWIESYYFVSTRFEIIFSDLFLKWVSICMSVLVALHYQLVINKIQINAIFAHDVLSFDIQHMAVCICNESDGLVFNAHSKFDNF